MKTIRYHQKKRRRSLGMALLFTMAILGTVLVIALLFASKARVEEKLAAQYVENQEARLLAKSLISRVIVTLQKSTQEAQGQMLYSTVYSETADTRFLLYDWIWKLESPGYFDFTPSDYKDGDSSIPAMYLKQTDGSANYDPQYLPLWQYIRDPDNKEVIARFAFVTVPVVSALNPNGLADHTFCKHMTSNSDDNVTSKQAACTICWDKPGVSPAELFYDQSVLFSSGSKKGEISDDYKSSFPVHDLTVNGSKIDWKSGTTLTSKYSVGHPWTDIQDFLNVFYSSEIDSEGTSDEIKAAIRKAFDVATVKSPEAFWSDDGDGSDPDTKGDGVAQSKEFYHRFNLRRTDWEELTVDDILSQPKQYDPDNPTCEFGTTTSLASTKLHYRTNYKTGGIAWLNNWSDGGDWSSRDLTKKQIAANLLNFCSPASRPVVSDVAPDKWVNQAPTYTGLKRTLYLNEAAYQIDFKSDYKKEEVKDTDGNVIGYDVSFEYYFDYLFLAELIDMYFDTLGATFPGQTVVTAAKVIDDAALVKALENTPPDFGKYLPQMIGSVSFEYWKPSADPASSTKGSWISYSMDLNDLVFQPFTSANSKVKSAATGSSRTSLKTQPETGYYGYEKSGTKDGIYNVRYEFRNADGTTALADDTKFKPHIRNIVIKIDRILVKREKTDEEKSATADVTFPTKETAGNFEYVDCSNLESKYEFQTGATLLPPDSSNSVEMADDANQTQTVIGHFEIQDPRQNLKRSDWEKTDCTFDEGNEHNSLVNGLHKPYDKSTGNTAPNIWRMVSLPVFDRSSRTTIIGTNFESGTRPATLTYLYSSGESVPTGGEAWAKKKLNVSNTDPQKRDCESTDDPVWARDMSSKTPNAWGVKLGKAATGEKSGGRVSTAYIRHPSTCFLNDFKEYGMASPWELGAIHRASAWQTLNLGITQASKTTENVNFVTRGGGEYKYGDGPLLDQVKMVNDVQVLGKVNLAGSFDRQAIRYFALGAVFYQMPYRKDGNYLRQTHDSDNAAADSLDPAKTGVNTLTDSARVIDKEENGVFSYKDYADALYQLATKASTDDGTVASGKQKKSWRRTDILKDAYRSEQIRDSSTETCKILWGTESGTTDALREQFIGRIINHLAVESSVRDVTVVIVVQTLKDTGGTESSPVYIAKDWNGNGEVKDSAIKIRNLDRWAQYQTGYRRYISNSETEDALDIFSSTQSDTGSVNEVAKGLKGSYEVGADAITGEAKLIVNLKFDSSTQKWKVDKYEYVE